MSDPKQDIRILLTNDDGIRSPGLWAAAEALSNLGFVTVAAPREQASGTGRSMPPDSDGILREERVTLLGQTWKVYAVGGTPAQAVQHGALELMPRPPDLIVAGINYGENVSTSITISGTVGAALEGAALGVPSMALSLETGREHHLSYSQEIDFSVAAYFGQYFAQLLLHGERVGDVDVLKIDVPSSATRETGWKITHLSRAKYYEPIMPKRSRLDEPGTTDYDMTMDVTEFEVGSDAHALRVERKVSVTPLSLDLTSRVNLQDYEQHLRRIPASDRDRV